MSELKLSTLIDKCISDNLELNYKIFAKPGGKWDPNPLTNISDLDAGITYRIHISLQNRSNEISFTNIKIAIAPPHIPGISYTPKSIELYVDEGLTQKLPDHFEKSIPGLLAPTMNSQSLVYYFKVTRDADSGKTARLLRIAIHADILPRGHSWTDISWKL